MKSVDSIAALASWLLLPVVLLQGAYLRLTVPRLGEAPGARSGRVDGAAPVLRLLVLGESTAAGVGAPDQKQAVARWTAETVAALSGRAVAWRVLGKNGATAHSLRKRLLEPAEEVEADLAVVILGVNDTLRFHGPRRWRRDLTRLLESLRERCGPVPVVLASVPPMNRFPAIPSPTRQVLGLRAARLGEAAAAWASAMEAVAYSPMPEDSDAPLESLFGVDGFHPSAEGYRRWGELLGREGFALLGKPAP
ncbi:SGNH/GDSL hydrolase family protein [Natronospira bacteriovora]|uniref:SGNH/GDSL hydrolase family protein n=1 Tax=Natronospira bacteriovora TaxID=3069753 RepID=A0ABU0W4P1_9GAMM|nr:SGNH/GDSL hydrolase family protein [Natronospira sp. AB-CW4]MDQ2068996.1 SGNH/GDSL hydrolase family protein [Natronospira sp. AB-CW4]